MSFGSSGSFPNYGSTKSQGGTYLSGTAAYHQLHDNISSSIFAINNCATSLERALKQLGTSNDSPSFRDQVHATQQNANETINTTTVYIVDMAALVRKGDRQQRLQLERLKNEFQETVRRYCSLQKQVATKMKLTLDLKSQRKPASLATGWMEDDAEEERRSLVDEDKKLQEQQQLENELEFEQGMLTEREQRIREIESDMLDVNQVFRDLAAMVNEQGETINTIEAHIEQTGGNVECGREQLQKASNYQKKYRMKMCLLVVILTIVVVAVVLVIVFTSRSGK